MIALSYSRLSTYMQCPFKFKSQYIDKDYPDEGENWFFVKGKKKHKQCENYILCKTDPTQIQMRYDGDVESVFPIIDSLIDQGYLLHAEQQLATTPNFEPCSWFSKQTGWRAICDMVALKGDKAIIGDFKTGKFRDYDSKPEGQLHLSSAIIFATYPEVNNIRTAYLYLEHKQTVQRQFNREMYNNGLLDPFHVKFKEVNEDKEFKATKNQYCHWCLLKAEGMCPL